MLGLAGAACRSQCASRWPSLFPPRWVIRSRSLCCVWPVLYLGTFGRQGVLQRTFAFPVEGFGGPKLTWLRRPKGLISKSIRRLARRPGAGSYHRVGGQVGPSPPRLALATCYVSLIRSRVRVGPVLCASRITGIPTGLCSRPPYRHQSSYRSLSPIAGKAWLQNRTLSFHLIRLLPGSDQF